MLVLGKVSFEVKYARMAAITNTVTSSITGGQLRPFNPSRDLTAVADLIELCFADTLDQDGKRYLQGMRNAARAPGFFFLASAAEEWSSVPLTGYIWAEDEQVVGNLSLIPYRIKGKRSCLIANVAVHPEYRRRGIARALTLKGIENARKRGAVSVWLQVREENEAALNLYRGLGFVERASRTTWFSSSAGKPVGLPEGIRVASRRAHCWQVQETWLEKVYPDCIRWNLPMQLNTLRPGLKGLMSRIFTATSVRQWAAWDGEELLGILACQSGYTGSNLLWLASPPQHEEKAAAALLTHARLMMGRHVPFVFDYPAHHASLSIDAAGFYVRQILVWMEIKF